MWAAGFLLASLSSPAARRGQVLRSAFSRPTGKARNASTAAGVDTLRVFSTPAPTEERSIFRASSCGSGNSCSSRSRAASPSFSFSAWSCSSRTRSDRSASASRSNWRMAEALSAAPRQESLSTRNFRSRSLAMLMRPCSRLPESIEARRVGLRKGLTLINRLISRATMNQAYFDIREPTAVGRLSGAERTRESLIRAGLRLFGQNGFDATSTRALAAEAGAMLGSIASHSGGKEGLRAACAQYIVGTLSEVAERTLGDLARPESTAVSPEEARAMLMQALQTMVGFVVARPEAGDIVQ